MPWHAAGGEETPKRIKSIGALEAGYKAQLLLLLVVMANLVHSLPDYT